MILLLLLVINKGKNAFFGAWKSLCARLYLIFSTQKYSLAHMDSFKKERNEAKFYNKKIRGTFVLTHMCF